MKNKLMKWINIMGTIQYVNKPEMTHSEKVEMYQKLKKNEIIEMLLESNNTIDKLIRMNNLFNSSIIEYSNLKVWNDFFNNISEELKKNPIYHRDSDGRNKVFLSELYENSDIDFDDGLDSLIDIIAFIVNESGYTIIKKIK